ncbi:unnamed protein product [Cyprideis torosa]|uniref:Uncharacterized protein n=1 Tax=Cyprideis torosa TaxID=163714 RepID=A0A7R8WL03_9CRUS|nr:unnamed protein product [Cyprideis torosa]CAG0896697.1 unnamed protein product [Cyprideis torosa]
METIEEGAELTKTRVVKGCSDNGHLEDSLDSYEERLREGTAHDELNIWTKVNELSDNRCDTIEEKLGTFKICSCDSDNCNDGTQPFGDNGSATLHVAFSTVVAALLISEVFRVHF